MQSAVAGSIVEGIMLRFSIREILLLTLTVACLAGWCRQSMTSRSLCLGVS